MGDSYSAYELVLATVCILRYTATEPHTHADTHTQQLSKPEMENRRIGCIAYRIRVLGMETVCAHTHKIVE